MARHDLDVHNASDGPVVASSGGGRCRAASHADAWPLRDSELEPE